MIKFTVPVPPVAKARPRVTMRGGFARAYTPKKTAQFEHIVADCCPLHQPISTPCHLSVTFHLPIPKSWSKAKQKAAQDGELLPVTRPDIDNYIKAVMDALNGVAYEDDSQVVTLTAAKLYSADPRVEIQIDA